MVHLSYSGILPISASVVIHRLFTSDCALFPASLRVTNPRCGKKLTEAQRRRG